VAVAAKLDASTDHLDGVLITTGLGFHGQSPASRLFYLLLLNSSLNTFLQSVSLRHGRAAP
jgi:hypothetical protein